MATASRLTPPPQVAASAASAEQILFFATHELSGPERSLFRHYSRQLRLATDLRSAFWVLLYKPWQDTVATDQEASMDVEGGVCAWGDGALRRQLPLLGRSIERQATSGMGKEADPNHIRYYWFTSSLLLWNRSYGHAYPSARFFWRVEPDVLFSGSWAALLLRFDPRSSAVDKGTGSRLDADVLLPRVTKYAEDPGYGHWERNEGILEGLPQSSWVFSLVSIGRYSSRFLAAMAEQWAAGTIGYEEILLPIACLKLGAGCRLQSMHHTSVRMTAHGAVAHSRITEHFRYKPEFDCSAFLRAAVRPTLELWHPVKHRDCWREYLDSCNATGCHMHVPQVIEGPEDDGQSVARTRRSPGRR